MKNNSTLVSVLMNCFNGEKYLDEALSSVLNQTYDNWEIIFWDNQSTDRSAEICKKYKDPRIRYFYAPTHTDLGTARIEAAKYLKGEWFTILDTDDYWFDNNISSKINFISSNQNIGLIYSKTVWDQSLLGKKSKIYPPGKMYDGYIFNKLIDTNFILLPGVMYNKKAFDTVGGFNKYIYCSDYDLSLRITKKYVTKSVDIITSVYRVHDNNMFHQLGKSIYDEKIMIIKDVAKDKLQKKMAKIEADYISGIITQKQFKQAFLRLVEKLTFPLLYQLIMKMFKRIYSDIFFIFYPIKLIDKNDSKSVV